MRAWAFSLSEVSIAGAFGRLVFWLFVGRRFDGPGLPREKLSGQGTDVRVIDSEVSPRDAHVAGPPFTGSAEWIEAWVVGKSASIPALYFLGEVVNDSAAVALH